MFRKISISILILTVTMALSSVSFAQDREVITVDNAASLSELIRISRGSTEEIAVSPDGAITAVGSSVGIWLYDTTAIDTELEPQLIVTAGEVGDIAYSPDGTTIAFSNSEDSIINFVDVASGELTGNFDPEFTTNQLRYSPDGSMLALGGGSQGLMIWDVAGQSVVLRDENTSLGSTAPVVFSPDGSTVASGASSSTLYMWDVAGDGLPMELAGHTSTIYEITFSPDGATLATGSSDRTIRLWNMDGTEKLVIEGTDDYRMENTYAIAFSPDGSMFVSGHRGQVRFWDAEGNRMDMFTDRDENPTNVNEIDDIGTLNEIAWLPDGSQFVAVSDNEQNGVQLYDAEGNPVATSVGHTTDITAITFSPNSSTLAFGDGDQFLYLWDTAAVEEINFSTIQADSTSFSADNLSMITYSSDGQYIATEDGFVPELRNAETGDLIRSFDADGLSSDIAFSPDDTMLAYISSQGVFVFDVESGEMLASFFDHNDWGREITWSPDQTMLASTASDNTVRVYTIGGE
ncbi:MAG: WD40 repeat domain-containing protein [Chloroflexota bacterium]